ncbi:substrate-binding periplasmic protein [Spartinivicinus poritis]|uniref:Transporter substrate-binding domain-containing protein n=1 Tax=Spartinivicinus poritis TaxID=2994640 RepID=A0ABT5U2V7_9GAMM|nr:transporter substrate-binding domain-containing protein [Spartinivicinus sp. A2-2]MDE1460691.1 transporter substrate-binding domain-containing protein [Spartinivicinus sp. A2-2]
MLKAVGLTLVFYCFTLQVCASCQLSVRVTDFPPQYYQDASGQWQGMSVELTEVLLNEMGCTPVYVKVPWQRSFILLKSGQLDLMTNLSITDDRKAFLNFIGPQRDETIVLVVHKNSHYQIKSHAELANLPNKIGFELGSYYGETFDVLFKQDPAFSSHFEAVTHSEQNIHKLNLKRISGFFGDLYSVSHRIKTDSLYHSVKIHPFVINQNWVYFGLSKQSVSIPVLKQLKKAYQEAASQNKFNQVLSRYK